MKYPYVVSVWMEGYYSDKPLRLASESIEEALALYNIYVARPATISALLSIDLKYYQTDRPKVEE